MGSIPMNEETTLTRQLGEAVMRLYYDGLTVLKDGNADEYERLKSVLKAGDAHVRIVIDLAAEFHVMGTVIEGDTATDIFELRATKLDAFGPLLTTPAPAPEAKS